MEEEIHNTNKKENQCKYGDECRSKVCGFNHPTRPLCRNADSCDRLDCWYNHEIQICHFGTKCSNKECTFRHPKPTPEKKNVQINQQKFKKINHTKGPLSPPVGSFPLPSLTKCSELDDSLHSSSQPKITEYYMPGLACNVFQQGPLIRSQDEPSQHMLSPETENAAFHPHPEPLTLNKKRQQNTLPVFANDYLIQSPQHNSLKSLDSHLCPPPESAEATGDLQQAQSHLSHSQLQFNPLLIPASNQSDSEQMNSFEIRAVEEHEEQIKLISEQINSIKCSQDFDIHDDKYCGTIKALNKRLSELREQLSVYKCMWSRAISCLNSNDLKHQLMRETYRFKSRLPALAKRLEIEQHIENNSSRFLK